MSTGANRACPKCGSTVLTSEGVCHACLLEVGLLDEIDPVDRAEVQIGSSVPSHTPQMWRDFGDYELLEELGRGGQGVVYRARQRSLNRIVALKVIAIGPWASETNLKRFRIEAEAAAKLDHPNIVPIYEIGERDGYCHFSMKFVEGDRLDAVTPRGAISIRRAAEIIARLARTVHYAHQRGILHRDIKPGNILLDTNDQPHLADFGLAKLVETESTITNTMDVLGTPSYMSPEQAGGRTKELTSATDIYALGAVLYQLLTGNPPFAGGTTMETIRQVLENEPRRPALWNPKLDRDVETICLKCLEKDPAKRYATAEALGEDLERWLRHEPIHARPSGVFTRTRKWIRRNPVPAALVPTIAALATAIAVIVWQRTSRTEAGAGNLKPLAIVLRAADTNSASLAKECSRELNHLVSRVSALAGIERSRVLKWEASSAPAEQIGKALRTKSVLLGTVERLDKDFRLNVELVDSARGTRSLSQSWTNLERNWPAIQTQIARDLVTRLNVTLTDKEQSLLRRPLTTNESALRQFFNARAALDMMTEASFTNALQLFEQAVHHDPDFAQAHAGLAAAHIYLGYSFQEPTEHFRKARLSINAALQLDDSLPEAKIANSLVKYFFEWDWQGAEQAVEDALRLDPSLVEANGCYLHALDVLGKGDEALRQVQRAVALHPNSPQIKTELGCAAYYAGHFDQAAEYCRENLKTDPENAMIFWSLGRTLAQKFAYDDALLTLRTAKTKTGGEWPGIDGEIGYVHARQGRTNETRQTIEQLRARERSEFVDPYIYAMIYAGSGNAEKAFEHLNRACDIRTPWIASLPVDPKFASLRSDPGYQQILARLKLPATRIPSSDRP